MIRFAFILCLLWSSMANASLPPHRAFNCGHIGSLNQYTGGTVTGAFDARCAAISTNTVTANSTAAQYAYSPFGEVLRATGPMAKANPFRFSTKYEDDETDLNYYGYRYYNPRDGRWLSRDPLGEAGGINLYAFCNNDPVNYVDTDGQQAIPGPGGFIGNQNGYMDFSDPKKPHWVSTTPQEKKDIEQMQMMAVDLVIPISAAQALHNGEVLAVAGEFAIGKMRIIEKIPGVRSAGNKCCIQFKAVIEVFAKPFRKQGGSKLETCVVPRARHYTDTDRLAAIKSSNTINPSRGEPIGVHVEKELFGPPATGAAETGAARSGAYVEIDLPPNTLPTIVGPRSTAIIRSDTPLTIENLNPTFNKITWWKQIGLQGTMS